MSIESHIGAIIRERRKRKDIKARDFAEMVYCSYNTLNRYESGRSKGITIRFIRNCAKVFGDDYLVWLQEAERRMNGEL